MTCPPVFRPWQGIFIASFLLIAPSTWADFSAFPLVHYRSGNTTDTMSLWAPWPFFQYTRTTDTLTVGIHPIMSWWKNYETGQSALHIVWPLVRRTYRPIAFKGENWKVLYLFPLLYFGRGERGDEASLTRYLLPIYYQGKRGRGEHLIVFPFVWYARDARLIWPLFPQRPQTFFALWPFYGDFRGYWNRDRIVFFLWPLFVSSRKGTGDEAVHIDSLVWPLTGFYSGKKYSGIRLWPLFSHVKKKDAFLRMYWLWPLGHHRSGLTPDEKTTQTLTAFFPLYAHMRADNFEYDFLFPFYGNVKVGKRTSTGYMLAIYNTTENERTGIREHRLFWFLLRWKTTFPTQEPEPPPVAPPTDDDTPSTPSLFPVAEETDPETGWALFPIYARFSSEVKKRMWILWPFYWYRWDRAREYEFERTYLVPFYSTQERRWGDGTISRSTFVVPFFKSSLRRDGKTHRHWLHLWWYDSVDGLDRNYAPLWTFYEKDANQATGAERVRVCKGLYEYDRFPDGREQSGYNFLIFNTRSSPESAETSLAWGLFGYKREAREKRFRLLWLINL